MKFEETRGLGMEVYMKKMVISKVTAAVLTVAVTLGSIPNTAYAYVQQNEQYGQAVTVYDDEDVIIQDGGMLREFNNDYELSKSDDSDVEGAENAIKKAWDGFAEEVDISKYNIKTSDIRDVYYNIINENPRYFYIGNSYSYYPSGDYVKIIYIRYKYDKSEAKKMVSEYNAAIANALAGIGDDWSELEKTLYLNDYLTVNTEYDTTYSNYSAYDALVKHKAVCQGYALAFNELAKDAGLKSVLLTSQSLNHAWNLVKVGDSYYHVDTTWDDPLNDLLGRARHVYFMKSSAYFNSDDGGHQATDWIISGGVTKEDASSSIYDNYMWDAIDTSFFKIGDLWYTYNSGQGGICSHEFDGSDMVYKEQVVSTSELWPALGGYYSSEQKVACINDVIYYSTPESVISYNPADGTKETYYTLTDEQKNSGYIYGLRIDEYGRVYISIAVMPNSTGKIVEIGQIEPSRKPVEPTTEPPTTEPPTTEPPTTTEPATKEDTTQTTETDTSEGYNKYKIKAVDMKTVDDGTVSTVADGKPKLIVFFKNGCWNCKNVGGRLLSGKDFSDIDVIFAEFCGATKDEVIEEINSVYSGLKGVTFCYDAIRAEYMNKPASVGGMITTPLILYIDKDNNVVYHTTGNDNDIVNHINTYLGVDVNKTETRPVSEQNVILSCYSYTYNGSECRPEVTVKDSDGNVISPDNYDVKYENNIDAGTASVTVTGKNSLEGEKTVYFNIDKAKYSIRSDVSAYSINEGESYQISAWTDADGLNYSSDNENIATVDSTGLVRGVSEGTTTINITTTDNKNYNKAFSSITISVKKAQSSDGETDISSYYISDVTDVYVYDGQPKFPEVIVTDGTTKLNAADDYILSYSNNVNAGTAVITVTGTGKYKGTLTKTFKIEKAEQDISVTIQDKCMEVGTTADITVNAIGSIRYVSSNTDIATVSDTGTVRINSSGTVRISVIASGDDNHSAATALIDIVAVDCTVSSTDIADANINLSADTYVYDGTEHMPDVHVEYEGKILEENKDYTLMYSDNINAGTATVLIAGMGEYGGWASKNYTINKAEQTVKASIEKDRLNVYDIAKITVEGIGDIEYTLSNEDIADVYSGYFMAYGEGEVIVTITAKGNKNYNEASTTLKVVISDSDPVSPDEPEEKLDIEDCLVEFSEDSYTYTGEEIRPDMIIKHIDDDGDEESLNEGEDYEITYEDNINAGFALVTVNGIGKYTGTLYETFEIVKALNTIKISKTVYSVTANISKPVTLRLDASAIGKIKYKTDKKSVKVTSSGKVTIAKKFSGIVKIIATSGDSDNYYSDECVITLNVKPAETQFTSVKTGRKKAYIKWKKNVTATGYEVQVSANSKFKSGVVKEKMGDNRYVSLTLSGLKSGKKYYVRIRAMKKVKYNGKTKTLYSSWSKVKSIKAK